MDISSLNTAFIDSYRVTAPENGITRALERGETGEQFAETMRKTLAASRESGGEPQGTNAAIIDKTDKLYEQCLELETFLVKTLISSMRSTVQKSGLIDEGFAGKMYEDMLYDEYAKDFTKSADFGLAEQVYLQVTGQRGKVSINA